jgi:DNA-binding response OmpR family regulator
MRRSPQPKTAACLNGSRILVVEDDFFIRIDLESILRDAGADIVGPCSGIADALAALANGKVTAAILDVRLGCETVAPVARELTKKDTPFVFYSGQFDADPTLAEWPNCRILTKPALPKTIVAVVADLLERKTQRDVRSPAA